MKEPRQKRIKVDKHGQHWPQYKWLFFWLCYRKPNKKKQKERFGDMWDAKQFLRTKHNQDLMAIERITKQGIVKWDPKA